jgi:uncharacterized membrane protein
MKLLFKIILGSITFLIFSSTHGYGAEFSFTEVRFPGAASTIAHGINDDGDVVGIYAPALFEPAKGFTLSANVYKEFSMPDSRMSLPFAINRKDKIVGTYIPEVCPCEQGAFLFDGKTFTHIAAVRADAINGVGAVVGYRMAPLSGHAGFLQLAYVYKNGAITGVAEQPDNPNFAGSAATGINDKGTIVGYWFFENGEACCFEIHGFIKKGKVTKDFDTDFPESNATFPLGINNSGTIVGIDSTGGGIFSWLYHGGEFSKIEVPGAQSTTVLGINNKGQIVGYSFPGPDGGDPVGFVGTPKKPGRKGAEGEVVN